MPASSTPTKKQARRPVHVPQRTCVICRRRDAKRQLTRIVRQPGGEVAVDPTGKMNGRGAYVCHDHACWSRAAQGQGLARALKTDLTPEALDRLQSAASEHLAALNST